MGLDDAEFVFRDWNRLRPIVRDLDRDDWRSAPGHRRGEFILRWTRRAADHGATCRPDAPWRNQGASRDKQGKTSGGPRRAALTFPPKARQPPLSSLAGRKARRMSRISAIIAAASAWTRSQDRA